MGKTRPSPPSHDDEELDALIRETGKSLRAIQKVRIETTNRIKSLTRRGIILDDEVDIRPLLYPLEALEKQKDTLLCGYVRQHFMAPWVYETKGFSYHAFGLIIGQTGPLSRFPSYEKLWKYTGFHVEGGRAPKRSRGANLGWKPEARTVCHIVAESLVKAGQGGKYRSLYDEARGYYLARPRLGPSGCPFEHVHHGDERLLDEDTGWLRRTGDGRVVTCVKQNVDGTESSAHVHSAAMRYAVKELLKDMWLEWHEREGERAA